MQNHEKHQSGKQETARKRREDALDQALKDTFPASDPISIVQPSPVSPQEPEDREKQKAAPIP